MSCCRRGCASAVFLLLLGLFLPASLKADKIWIQNESGAAGIDPFTLEVVLGGLGRPQTLVSIAQTNLGRVANADWGDSPNPSRAKWSLPDRKMTVSVALEGRRLRVHLLASEPGEFAFPMIPASTAAKGWILPFFEGVYAPCDDVRWHAFLTNRGPFDTTADLTLPFIGLDYGARTLACILTNPFNNRLEFRLADNATLCACLTHEFTRNHPVKEYAAVFEPGTNSLVEPARLYRQWLIGQGQFVSLNEKIGKTLEAAKLPGAAHAYLWGNELLAAGDITDWKGFARVLKAQGEAAAPSAGRRLWALMKPEPKKVIGQVIRAEWPDRFMKSQIAEELNRLLEQRDLYEESAWGAAGLDSDRAALLKADRATLSQAEVGRLNAHLLAAAFPGMLAPPEAWGNGTSPKMIKALAAAGLDRMCLASDGWKGFLERPETIAAARKAGFLIGPYDSYHSIHRPEEPDSWETAQFDAALYERGAIVNADGSKRRGFQKKGFTLSPAAARPYVEKRVARLMEAFHANSWFMDCDGFGEYFDDYSELHPATQQSDMQARIARMAWIRDTYGAAIGTEGCSAGVASTVHFAHGVMTPVIGWGDPDLKNKQSKYFLGAYYPPGEPQVFFKPVPIKEEYRYIYYNPQFRLPLFEAVFHDSVVATHHWTFGSLKAKDEAGTMELLELLYQVPPLYHLNLQEFQKRKAQIQRHYAFFSPLHRETALLPLTSFDWLASNGLVQRTTFGDQLELVANFGTSEFHYGETIIHKRSILAKRRDAKPQEYVLP